MAAHDRRAIAGLRPVLMLIALVSLGAVGAALLAQHRFGMQPCPWCILQRIEFLLIALLSALGALVAPPWAPRPLSRLSGWLVAAVAACGAASAAYQHFVAAKSNSCNLTLADRIISALKLDASWPEVFEVRSSCADAATHLAGLPFEFWSLGLFVLLAGAGLWCAVRAHAR